MKPSTKIITALLSVVLVCAVVYFFVAHVNAPTVGEERTFETVSRPEVSLTFAYPSGAAGLGLIEPATTESTMLKEVFILMPAEDYERQRAGEIDGESPASISIFVFAEEGGSETATTTERPGRITRLQTWAAENENLTSFSRAKNTPEVVDLDGVSALYYEADGLYQQQIYLASYKGNVYMFVGQYDAPTDAIYQHFKQIMTKVSFD